MKNILIGDTVYIKTYAVDQKTQKPLNGKMGVVENISRLYEVRIGNRVLPFAEGELFVIPSEVQAKVLRNIQLLGKAGRYLGNLSPARRKRFIENLVNKGWLDKNSFTLTPLGVEVSAPFFNPAELANI